MKSRRIISRGQLPLKEGQVEITGDNELMLGDLIFIKKNNQINWVLNDTVSSWKGCTPARINSICFSENTKCRFVRTV